MNVEYKLIRQIATAKLINDTLPFLSDLQRMNNNGSLLKISTKLSEVVKQLLDYSKLYINDSSRSNQPNEKLLITEIYQLCEDKNYFDEEMKAILNSNLQMLKNSQFLIHFKDANHVIPDSKINLAVDYILARKLFRPNITAAIKAKKETILNIKIDETN